MIIAINAVNTANFLAFKALENEFINSDIYTYETVGQFYDDKNNLTPEIQEAYQRYYDFYFHTLTEHDLNTMF